MKCIHKVQTVDIPIIYFWRALMTNQKQYEIINEILSTRQNGQLNQYLVKLSKTGL